GLLSELALQRLDGTWVESTQWHVFFSLEKGRLSATADGLLPQDFKAIRFRVGLDGKTDKSDPGTWPPEYPLHPDVCGLHWGWNSGYVFLAVEGHWERAGTQSGFSYHLAGASKPMMVEIPVQFSGAGPTTIFLGLDLAEIMESGSVLEKATSTHSRDGDKIGEEMKGRVSRAFRLKGVVKDIYRDAEPRRAPEVVRSTKATPLRFTASERLPQVTLPKDNPLTIEGVELGRRLFHEPRLSRNDAQSCASCHDQARAFTDGQKASQGVSGERGRRNAMPLANLAWQKNFFWDGRANSLREQVLAPIQAAHEMNETLERVVAKLEKDPEYVRQFKQAFGQERITASNMALALEQFLLTLVSQESKFDQAARKLTTLTSQELKGLQLFVTEYDPARGLRGADCFHCHGGNLFSNHQFLNNGLEERAGDGGRMDVTGSEGDRGKFKVPTLRNVALTGPYMHDGRFATLQEVVEHYNGRLYRSRNLDPNLAKHPEAGLGLTAEDKAALVAFLKTLTDEVFVGSRTNPHEFSQNK
ncbi:MAG TPA: MbnP family protein, partial [Candidatus Saccharimonadales bacterium]|nr:MbnP family protein [Candidatus Saccharimonadales bacterium]